MTSDTIKFDKSNLNVMLDSKTELLEQAEGDLRGVKSEMMQLLGGAPEQLFPVLVEPILSNLKDEDTTKEFAKLMVLAKRYLAQIDSLRKEVSIVHSLLDEQSPLRMAAINFDEIDLFKGDR